VGSVGSVCVCGGGCVCVWVGVGVCVCVCGGGCVCVGGGGRCRKPPARERSSTSGYLLGRGRERGSAWDGGDSDTGFDLLLAGIADRKSRRTATHAPD
jgi:hypothetical protein